MTSSKDPVTPAEVTETSHPTPRALTPIQEVESMSETRTVIFHIDADLEAIVETRDKKPTVYKVCRAALAYAFPAWRSLLDGNVACAHEPKERQLQKPAHAIELTGDSESIGLLFRIVHYDFGYVPQTLSLDQLYELSKVTCEYRCQRILRPWATQWTAYLTDHLADAYSYSHCHKTIWIAWTFGDLKLFRDAVDALIISTKIDTDGKIVNDAGQPLMDIKHMPRGLVEIATKTRASTVSDLLKIVISPIEILASQQQSQPHQFCRIGTDSQACEAMMLGSVIPALAREGLFPLPKPQEFKDSVVNLKKKIDKVKTMAYVGREWKPHASHENCDLGFRESIATCLKDMMVPLSAFILDWMSGKAETCGIEATSELIDWRLRSKEPSGKGFGNLSALHNMEEKAKEACNDVNSINAQEANSGLKPEATPVGLPTPVC